MTASPSSSFSPASLPSGPAGAYESSAQQPQDGLADLLKKLGGEALRLFQAVPLAVVVLSLLAMGIMLGVFYPQEGTVDPYQIRDQFGQNYIFLKSMGLFQVYSSPWFLLLEGLFFFNLLLGSFKWLRPAYLAATQKTILPAVAIEKALEKSEHPLPQVAYATQWATRSELLQQLKALLKKEGYHVTVDTEKVALYGNKGRWFRMGPAVAHIGILLILLASLYGAFYGFKAQKVAVPGDTFTIQQADQLTTMVNPSVWLGNIPPWQVRVKDFRIQYYSDHPTTVQQYYCALELLDTDGRVMETKTISVNDPLMVQDFSIYQASFAPTGKVWMTLDGKRTPIEVTEQLQNRSLAVHPLNDHQTLLLFPFYVQQDQVPFDHVRAFVLTHQNGTPAGPSPAGSDIRPMANTPVHGDSAVGGRMPPQMPENLMLQAGESGKLKGHTIGFERLEYATGLQLKRAPEVPLMMLAFLIVCVGTTMCFFPQRQLWLGLSNGSTKAGTDTVHTEHSTPDPSVPQSGLLLSVLSKTNKDRRGFQSELNRLYGQLMALGVSRSAHAPVQKTEEEV